MCRAVDLPHAAFADLGGDFVMAEPGTDFERHGLLGLTLGVILSPGGQPLKNLQYGFEKGPIVGDHGRSRSPVDVR